MHTLGFPIWSRVFVEDIFLEWHSMGHSTHCKLKEGLSWYNAHFIDKLSCAL